MTLTTTLASADAKPAAILFLHIPKSGGTTLHAIIERQYPAERIYTIDGTHVRESIAAFQALPEPERARLLVLKGHMAYGLHAWLPQTSTYITLLRDPIERAISHYYHILRSPHHTHYPTVVSQNMSLHDFAEAGVSRLINNGQVRALAAMEHIPYGECTANMLTVAEANIESHFSVVGFTERFDETLVLCRHTFGWKIDAYARRNVGKNRPATEKVPAATLTLLEELNQLDMQLYTNAWTRFDRVIKQMGASFSWDVWQLQWGNTLRGYYGSLVRRTK